MGKGQWGESEVLEKDVSERLNRPQSGTGDGGPRMAQATYGTACVREHGDLGYCRDLILLIYTLEDPVGMNYFIKSSSLPVQNAF